MSVVASAGASPAISWARFQVHISIIVSSDALLFLVILVKKIGCHKRRGHDAHGFTMRLPLATTLLNAAEKSAMMELALEQNVEIKVNARCQVLLDHFFEQCLEYLERQ